MYSTSKPNRLLVHLFEALLERKRMLEILCSFFFKEK